MSCGTVTVASLNSSDRFTGFRYILALFMYLDLPLERPLWTAAICPDPFLEEIVDIDSAGNATSSAQIPPVPPPQVKPSMQSARAALAQFLVENQATESTAVGDGGHPLGLSDSVVSPAPITSLQECMPPPAAFPAVRGTALFVITCSMNHSCSPNVSVIWQASGEAAIVANRNIEKDEELNISYVDEGLDYSERQEMLSGYGFTCDAACNRCRFDHDFFSTK
jgi:hypothetical protein